MEKRPSLRGNHINWNQLFFFNKIALYGSVKEAAQELGVAPSTLSEHLAQLEKDLEVELFFRRHRKLVLTPEGHRLFSHTRQTFESSQRILDSVSPVPLGCYPVWAAITPGPSVRLANQIIGHYLARFGIQEFKVVRCSHEELERGILESRFDFGFSDKGTARKGLVPKIVAKSRIRFYVSSALSKLSTEAVFRDYPLLVCSSETDTLGFVKHLLEDLDIVPKGQIASEFPSLVYDLCAAGIGIGVFNEEAVKSMKLEVEPVKVSSATLEIEDDLYVLWSREAEKSEAVKNLRKLLSESGVDDRWAKFRFEEIVPRRANVS